MTFRLPSLKGLFRPARGWRTPLQCAVVVGVTAAAGSAHALDIVPTNDAQTLVQALTGQGVNIVSVTLAPGVDFSDGQRIECYTAVADRDMDLAVLRCDTGARAPISLDPRIPSAGTPVGVVGYPGGVGPTATTGQITGERVVARGIETVGFTAAIASGSSGSPVFDSKGNVLAVATFSGGLGVPIERLLPLLKAAKRYPATKEAAEWRLRIRRSVIAGVSTLVVAWFFARRYGRNDPWKVAIRWAIFMVFVALALTQLFFAIRGPASFI